MQKKKKKRAKRTTDWPRMIHISRQSPKYLLNNPYNHPPTSQSCRRNNNFRLIYSNVRNYSLGKFDLFVRLDRYLCKFDLYVCGSISFCTVLFIFCCFDIQWTSFAFLCAFNIVWTRFEYFVLNGTPYYTLRLETIRFSHYGWTQWRHGSIARLLSMFQDGGDRARCLGYFEQGFHKDRNLF